MTVLIVVFVVLLVGVVGRGIYVWFKNNRSPQVTAEARVFDLIRRHSASSCRQIGVSPAQKPVSCP